MGTGEPTCGQVAFGLVDVDDHCGWLLARTVTFAYHTLEAKGQLALRSTTTDHPQGTKQAKPLGRRGEHVPTT
jgi:hypothetical protein